MKRLILLAALLAGMMPANARAATEYVLIWTNYNPYYTQVVGGPFATLAECHAIQLQESYQPGGMYSCRSIYVPGAK
jgi:hypothetical protein